MARIDVTAFLAEQAKRAAEIDAIQARLGGALDDFVARATTEQAALFAGACAERAVGILLWKATEEGRQDEAAAYMAALEQVWGGTTADARITSNDVEGMFELTHHDEAIRKDPLVEAAGFAEEAALAMRSALLLVETGRPDHVRAISRALWKDATQLKDTAGEPQLESAEIDRQIADMAAILEQGTTEELKAALRDQSRQVGREWLDLVVASSKA